MSKVIGPKRELGMNRVCGEERTVCCKAAMLNSFSACAALQCYIFQNFKIASMFSSPIYHIHLNIKNIKIYTLAHPHLD